MRLSEIADIHAGYLFRRRVEKVEHGTFQVLQPRDITPDDRINWATLIRVDLDAVKSVFLVEEGDILFRAKGSSHTAVVVDRTAENTVASSFFFIIRPRTPAVIPEYLAWYINQPPSQQQLNRTAAGTGIRIVNRSNLRRLEVVAPDLATQKKIVQLFRLRQRERQLAEEIQERRHVLVNAVMLDAVRHQNEPV